MIVELLLYTDKAGVHFYWLCKYSAIKEMLEYNGSIHQLERWSPELLAYNIFFFIVLEK